MAKPGPALPGQQLVTQAQFEAIALAQVTELWTEFGELTEIWFDGGYTSDMKAKITKLLDANQPNASAFGGLGVTANAICWVGTESGNPGGEIWSTGGAEGRGDASSSIWCPKGCDTTLQNGDVWFYEKSSSLRTLADLIEGAVFCFVLCCFLSFSFFLFFSPPCPLVLPRGRSSKLRSLPRNRRDERDA